MHGVGARTAADLNGQPCLELELHADLKKAVTVSRSFGKRITGISRTVAGVGVLRRAGCGEAAPRKPRLEVHARVHAHQPFCEGRGQGPLLRAAPLLRPCCCTRITPELVHYALWALGKMYRPGYRYMKCGVMLTDLIPDGAQTMDLFDRRDTARQAKLMARHGPYQSGDGQAHSVLRQFRHPAEVSGASTRKSPAIRRIGTASFT